MEENKLKTYKFWVSLSSALFLVLQTVLKIFGINLSEEAFIAFVDSILGVFVLTGFLKPKDEQEQKSKDDENEK